MKELELILRQAIDTQLIEVIAEQAGDFLVAEEGQWHEIDQHAAGHEAAQRVAQEDKFLALLFLIGVA